MSLGNVYMKDTDGNIGTTPPSGSEHVCGLLFDISGQTDFWTTGKGLEIAETFKNTVVVLNSLTEATEAGITARADENNEGADANLLAGIPYYHISRFFAMANGNGRLYVMFADCSKNWDALLEMQRASNGIISQFGIWTEQPLWTKMDESADTYSLSIVGDIQAVAEDMANNYFAPAHFILTANTSIVKTASGTSKEIALSEIPTCIVNARYVSVLLSQSTEPEVREMQGSLESTTPVGVVGHALGMLARTNVGTSIAWANAAYNLSGYPGNIPGIEMGFGNAEVVNGVLSNSTQYSALSRFQRDELDTKGYMFMRTYEGLEGQVFFSKDRSCSNGDYCTIARNRTINKSRRLVRAALLPYVNSPIKVDPANGNLSAAQITNFTNLISQQLTSMENAEEITAVGKITVPANQNILVNKTLTLSYTLIPMACAESIEVTEGLAINR